MLYDVNVNGKLVATVGPTELEHVSVSVSTSSHDGGMPFLIASGMSPRTEVEGKYIQPGLRINYLKVIGSK